MKKEDFQDLVGKYTSGGATAAEQRLLEAYYERLAGGYDPLPSDQEERIRLEMLEEILRRTGIEKPLVVGMAKSSWWRYAAAAVIFLLVAGGGYFTFFNKARRVEVKTQAGRFKNDVLPGGTKAILTLANGAKIVLDSAGKGQIAQQGGVGIQLLRSGQLTYRVLAAKPTAVLYNILQTPRGGMFRLRLPDGSMVWLNSESSIKYPVFFAGDRREVELSGEAYFEIVKDASKPFTVRTSNQTVEVLGTDFDIDAYKGELSIKTTLLRGSVRVKVGFAGPVVGVNTNNNKPSVVLRPGEQARLTGSQEVVGDNTNKGGERHEGDEGRLIIARNIDTSEVMAWKNGVFRFNDVSIETIMKNAARWYDVDVDYQTDNKLSFVATISRDVPISKLLKLLELTDRVHFKIDGKKITVLP